MRTKKQMMGMALALLLAAPLTLPQMSSQAKGKPAELNRTTATLHVGDKLQLKVKGTKKKVTWSTSSKVASVSKKGMVIAKKTGKVTVKAEVKTKSAKGKVYKCRIQVVNEEKTDDSQTGRFQCAESTAVTKELRVMFDKAMDGLVGVNYEPVAYLGSQIVAGTNHCFLCRATVVYPGANPSYEMVYIHAELNGELSVLEIREMFEGDSRNTEEEPVCGGWSTSLDSSVTAELQKVFDKALEGLTGVDYEPVAYLGSQVVAGTNHCFLCRATVVYPGAEPSYVRMYVNEDLEGNVTILDVEDVTM